MDTSTTTELPWLLSVFDVAELTHKQPTTVRKAIRDGRLAASDPKAGAYVITRGAVAAWLGLDVEDIRNRCSSRIAGESAAA